MEHWRQLNPHSLHRPGSLQGCEPVTRQDSRLYTNNITVSVYFFLEFPHKFQPARLQEIPQHDRRLSSTRDVCCCTEHWPSGSQRPDWHCQQNTYHGNLVSDLCPLRNFSRPIHFHNTRYMVYHRVTRPICTPVGDTVDIYYYATGAAEMESERETSLIHLILVLSLYTV